RSPAGMGVCSAMRRISLRTCGGKSTDVGLRSLALRWGAAREIFVRAMSMPSAEVPDIRPRTRSGFLSGGIVKGNFTTERAESTEKKERRGREGYGGEEWSGAWISRNEARRKQRKKERK